MDFYNTVMGKRFYENTMPSIAKSLEKIAGNLEKTEKEKLNEAIVILKCRDYFYFETNKKKAKDVLREFETLGFNFDNISLHKIIIRNENEEDIDSLVF